MLKLTRLQKNVILRAAESIADGTIHYSCSAIIRHSRGKAVGHLAGAYAEFYGNSYDTTWFSIWEIPSYNVRKEVRVLLLLSFLEANK